MENICGAKIPNKLKKENFFKAFFICIKSHHPNPKTFQMFVNINIFFLKHFSETLGGGAENCGKDV